MCRSCAIFICRSLIPRSHADHMPIICRSSDHEADARGGRWKGEGRLSTDPRRDLELAAAVNSACDLPKGIGAADVGADPNPNPTEACGLSAAPQLSAPPAERAGGEGGGVGARAPSSSFSCLLLLVEASWRSSIDRSSEKRAHTCRVAWPRPIATAKTTTKIHTGTLTSSRTQRKPTTAVASP